MMRWFFDGMTAIVCVFFLYQAIPGGRQLMAEQQLPTSLPQTVSPDIYYRHERDKTNSLRAAEDQQSRGGREEGGSSAMHHEPLEGDMPQHMRHYRPGQSLHRQRFYENPDSYQYRRKAAPYRLSHPAGLASGASAEGGSSALHHEPLEEDDMPQQHVRHYRPDQSLHNRQRFYDNHLDSLQNHRKAGPLYRQVNPARLASPGTSADVTRLGGCAPWWICYPGLKSSGRNVTDRTQGVEKTLPVLARAIKDGYPTPFVAPNGQKAIMCLNEKSGSTRWKMLMHKTAWKDSEARDGRPPNWLREGDEIHEMASPWLRWVHRPQDVFHMIYDPSYLRVMMVRNPYSRLLSAFLDKACTPINGYWAGIQKLIGGLYQPTPEDFQRFIVRLLYLKSRNPRDRHLGSEPHFTPLTTHCGIDAGVQYDLILKVEEIDMWYPDIVHILGLQEHVGSGWDANPRQDPPAESNSRKPPCFYKLANLTCEQTSRVVDHNGGDEYHEYMTSALDGGGSHQPSWMKGSTTHHTVGADSQISKFYNSAKTVMLATEFMGPDLEAFGYEEMPPPQL